ncbi:hypothetical protein GCM10007175_15220 [Pseudarthrobacter scleromae]|uniref:Uncharacterized protein n=1 Tax=Pseudarthrobacter scleromae TaxID=158897 RepID=A0ABQ2CDM0_9MICC|nr:hypothetical protein GCM10007175_15220 [Pseudarthrobacter scleromae]
MRSARSARSVWEGGAGGEAADVRAGADTLEWVRNNKGETFLGASLLFRLAEEKQAAMMSAGHRKASFSVRHVTTVSACTE